VVALNNLGCLLRTLGRSEEAERVLRRGLEVDGRHAALYDNLGNVLKDAGELDEAIDCFRKALDIDPGNAATHSNLAYTLSFQSLEPAPILDQCVRWNARFAAPLFSPPDGHPREAPSNRRLKIGYVSADFRDHPVSSLAAGLFETHDRSRFETYGLSFGPDDPAEMRSRLKAAFDRFVDVQDRSDLAAANILRELEVDIAIDLMGLTANSRLGIFAARPSPVQINYLGYAGTTGADYIDYLIADRSAIPPDQRGCFSEKVVYLPDSFQPNDAKRRISERTPSRAEAGLPDHGFVFCCFNNAFKITPDLFDIWMRLLGATEGSVLWLSAGGSARDNLRREAQRRGVSPDRLIFAAKTPLMEDHLARYRLADMFLDTLHFNAHTTASDALWAGLPVLTCAGATYAGRVAGSLLHAVGLPELITCSLDAYEALALKLAREPALLASFRHRLARHRDTFPLFDTVRITRHLESAYASMWERQQRGEPPESFAVAPMGPARENQAKSG